MKSEFKLGRLPSGLSWTEVLVFVCELDESSGDLWYRHPGGRGFGKLDWLGNGRLRGGIGAFLGPAATVTTCSFFATILDHLHLLAAQVPTPQ